MPPEALLTFLAASLLITLVPGPDNLMVLSLGVSRGRRAGFGFALGCALGCLTHTLWATLGISAVLMASETGFTVLKMVGGGYLIWLGIGVLRSDGSAFVADHGGDGALPDGMARYVARGFIANAVNPKVALFFLAFLPQFVAPELGRVALQMALLGTIFSLQTVVVFGALGLFAGSVGRWLGRHTHTGLWLDRATGSLFVVLGLSLLLA